jgi:hypothetical protein
VTDTVQITVAPELGTLVRDLLSGPLPVAEGRCTVAEVGTEEPLQTLATLGGQGSASAAQLWIPDDVSWAARAGTAVTSTEVTLGQTPVVLATSRSSAQSRGWITEPPSTWAQAMTASDLVLVDPVAEAEGLQALAAAQSDLAPPNTTGSTDAADAVVTQLVLTASGPVAPQQALTAAVAGVPEAPVVVATEHQVRAATSGGAGDLVVVIPTEGAPVLQQPVLRTTVAADDASVGAVLTRLSDPSVAGEALRSNGWRDLAGRGTAGEAPPALDTDPAGLATLAARAASLMTPSRLLTVVDVSLSMDAPVGDGTRATVARDALTSALSVLPDRTIGALWIFAAGLVGPQDWQEIVPARPFGTLEEGRTQRQLLAEEFATLPERLTGGGTGLYDTVQAAVRAAREGFDPGAVNTVVLLTDGTDDDPTGLTQQQLLTTLAAEADPTRPVQLVAVGVGPDVDLAALRAIVEITGGATYAATAADDLRTILFDAVRRRP